MNAKSDDDYVTITETVEDILAEVVCSALEDNLAGVPRYKLLVTKCKLEPIRDKDPNAVICLDRLDAAWETAPNTPPPEPYRVKRSDPLPLPSDVTDNGMEPS
jgi:hypothetical protein